MCCGLGCPHHQETTRTHVLLFIHVGDQKWTDKYKWPLVNLGVIQDSLIIMSTRAFSQNPSNLPHNTRGQNQHQCTLSTVSSVFNGKANSQKYFHLSLPTGPWAPFYYKKYGEPCIEYRPLICNNITGRNPPKSLISLLTPEESFAVFLKAVLAAARSSVLESPAMASSANPLSFSKTKKKKRKSI